MAKFENGSLKNIGVVDGTGEDFRVRFTLLLRFIDDENDLICPAAPASGSGELDEGVTP